MQTAGKVCAGFEMKDLRVFLADAHEGCCGSVLLGAGLCSGCAWGTAGTETHLGTKIQMLFGQQEQVAFDCSFLFALQLFLIPKAFLFSRGKIPTIIIFSLQLKHFWF